MKHLVKKLSTLFIVAVLAAVSYTHLDVYKRQVSSLPERCIVSKLFSCS